MVINEVAVDTYVVWQNTHFRRSHYLYLFTQGKREVHIFTLIKDWYSSFSLCTHRSPSRGPALVLSSGIAARAFLVPASTILVLQRPLTVEIRTNSLEFQAETEWMSVPGTTGTSLSY